MAYILALDQGTTSSRAILFDQDGAIAAVAQHEFQQFYPQTGWVEHDPTEILTSQMSCAVEALVKANAQPRDCGRHRHHQPARDRDCVGARDRQAHLSRHCVAGPPHRRFCRSWRSAAPAKRVAARPAWCSIRIFRPPRSGGFWTTWLGRAHSAERGELAFGTVDSWLIWHLTSGQKHVTDVTNASRTLLFNIVKGEWDEELLEIFDVPESMLPEVVWSSESVGEVTTTLGPRPASRSRASPATSRPRSSASCAGRRARPKTPTAPAASCCRTSARNSCARSIGSLPRLPPAPSGGSNTRSKAASLSAARWCNGCATI